MPEIISLLFCACICMSVSLKSNASGVYATTQLLKFIGDRLFTNKIVINNSSSQYSVKTKNKSSDKIKTG